MKVKVNELKENPNNPRFIRDSKFEQLVKSIREFPEMLSVRKLVVNKDYIVLGGNMRLKAIKEAGVKEVDIEVVDWNEEKEKEFIVKDNLGYGEWDFEMLANEWEVESLTEWGLDIPNLLDEEKKIIDIASNIENLYRIEIICKDEEHQEKVYNKLIEEGYECRILTL